MHYEDLEINKITPCCKVEIPEAWRGSKTFMQLNHINHIHDDARRENLELICSNCHSARTQSWLEMKLDGKRGRFSKNTEVLKKLRKEMEVK